MLVHDNRLELIESDVRYLRDHAADLDKVPVSSVVYFIEVVHYLLCKFPVFVVLYFFLSLIPMHKQMVDIFRVYHTTFKLVYNQAYSCEAVLFGRENSQ
jgi:hypothetical protein